MGQVVRWAVAPVVEGLTYRRFVHLLLGAVVLLPYLALIWLFVTSISDGNLDPVALVALLVPAAFAAIGVALVPGVRALEVTAARTLLGADVPDPDPVTADAWPARRRAAVWLLIMLVAGGATAVATLTAVPTAVALLLAPWTPLPPLPTGWAAAWSPIAGLLIPVALLHAVNVLGAGLARLAPRLLGSSPTERLAAELAESRRNERRLTERNRLASELHDSVGHALTLTTLQAEAAARVLDDDLAFARRALDAIAEAGRTAMAELDHVLGLLREGGEDIATVPQPDLGDLDTLLEGTRTAGVRVDAQLVGAAAAVPPVVSREAYRIVQEGLTNALRHAGPVPVSLAIVIDDAVELELINPIGTSAPRNGGGRGLAGMRERVRVLRGELNVGADGGVWRVRARLPLAP